MLGLQMQKWKWSLHELAENKNHENFYNFFAYERKENWSEKLQKILVRFMRKKKKIDYFFACEKKIEANWNVFKVDLENQQNFKLVVLLR